MRLIPLENAHNFRDLGGYSVREGGQTRAGKIFRSDTISRLSAADRATVRDLNIRTVVDLRREDEQTVEGFDELDDGIDVIHMPTGLGVRAFFSKVGSAETDFTLADFYIGNLAERAAFHAELFRIISDSKLQPIVFHCSAGKDRTGIMAALLLRVAGVADDQIIRDYTETAINMRESFEKQLAGLRKRGRSYASIRELYSCEAVTMERLLAHIDTAYGSAEDYLRSGGTTSEEIERFTQGFVQSGAG